jgi:hypothetical protein
MAVKCVNSFCNANRHHDEGKLFRLDLDIGSRSGEGERRTEYIWLCPDCAERMHPRVEVNGNNVTVRLSKNLPMALADTIAPLHVRLN